MTRVLISIIAVAMSIIGCSCSNQDNVGRKYYAVVNHNGAVDTLEILNFYMNANTYHLVKIDGTSTFINIDSAFVVKVDNDTTYY